MLQINDTVKIINVGNYYPTHKTAAEKMKATKWRTNVAPQKGEKGTIVNMYIDNLGFKLYLVDLGKDEIILNARGIEKIKEWDDEVNRQTIKQNS